jgi:hypothetical protein
MMEVVCTSKMSVNSNVTTRRHIPEHSKLHTWRREKLKSHTADTLFEHTWSSLIATQELAGNPWSIGTRNCRHPDQWPINSIIQIRLNIRMNTLAMLRNCNEKFTVWYRTISTETSLFKIKFYGRNSNCAPRRFSRKLAACRCSVLWMHL